jgi:hypothetical protein
LRKFANVADDVLALETDLGATSSTLDDASEFPSTGDFSLRFESVLDPTQYEIVTATARAGDVLTHEATTEAWAAGDRVYHVVAKVDLDSFRQHGAPDSLVGVRAFHSGATSIPHNTSTVVSLDGTDWDTHEFLQGDEIIIPEGFTGTYQVIARMFYPTSGAGDIAVLVMLNGVPVVYDKRNGYAPVSGSQVVSVAQEISIAEGDTVELAALQRTGGALVLVPSQHLALRYIGTP